MCPDFHETARFVHRMTPARHDMRGAIVNAVGKYELVTNEECFDKLMDELPDMTKDLVHYFRARGRKSEL